MKPPYLYDHPGVYAIHIDGQLPLSWGDYLGDVSIKYVEAEVGGDRPITVIKGTLADQAALLGILNMLYNNNYPLLFVRYLRPGIDAAPVTRDQEV